MSELDLAALGKMTFANVDEEAFPLITLAKRAMAEGGAVCAVMNAADEIAVAAFLDGKIGFADISDTVVYTVDKLSSAKNITALPEIIEADREARAVAKAYIKENLA